MMTVMTLMPRSGNDFIRPLTEDRELQEVLLSWEKQLFTSDERSTLKHL